MSARWVELAGASLRDARSAAAAAEQSLRLAFGDDHPLAGHVRELVRELEGISDRLGKAAEIVEAAARKVAAAEGGSGGVMVGRARPRKVDR